MLLIKLDLGPENDLAVAVVVFGDIHKPPLTEVGVNGKLFAFENTDLGLEQFAEVVGQNGGGHTHGNTVAAQHEQTGNLHRQNNRFFAAAVVRVHKLGQVVIEKHFPAQL